MHDPNEPGLAGVTVYLDLNDNGILDNEPSIVSAVDDPATPGVDEMGTYEFDALADGTYLVRTDVPIGFERTSPVEEALSLNFAEAYNKNRHRPFLAA